MMADAVVIFYCFQIGHSQYAIEHIFQHIIVQAAILTAQHIHLQHKGF